MADRGNVRLQVFDQDGKFLEQTTAFSRLSGIYIDKNDMLYGADSESSETHEQGLAAGHPHRQRQGSEADGTSSRIPGSTVEDATGTSAAEGVAVDAPGQHLRRGSRTAGLKKYVKK